jgi:undecaprenol kinase/diacylglycerol kinase (ATP)
MKYTKFSLRRRLTSFIFAFNGIKILLKEEHNSRIHLFAALVAIASGFILKISVVDWIAITFSIGMVITVEVINTAIEKFADFIKPERHLAIKKIKDLSAAAVLISSITALIIGIIVFIPKILELC